MMTLTDTRILVTIQVIDDTQGLALMFAFATGLLSLVVGFASTVERLAGHLLCLVDTVSTYLTVGGIVGRSVLWGCGL